MTIVLDPTDPVHVKAQRMLEHELIAWFVTVGKDGAPRAVPVWFFWHDGRLAILSEPNTGKVAAVRRGAPVLIHLQAGGAFGDDVVILHGTARLSEQSAAEWISDRQQAYLAKYQEAIDDFGTPFEPMIAQFNTVIEFIPERLQAW